MTLILGMFKDDGVYMSADCRVTRLDNGKIIDPFAVKHLIVQCPPDEGGPIALFGFTGLAQLRGGKPLGDWLRETLSGITRSFDQTMAHLQQRLNRDVLRFRVPLMVLGMVVEGQRQYLAVITNTHDWQTLLPSFDVQVILVDGPHVFSVGADAATAQVKNGGHEDLMRAQAKIRPRRPLDHMKLLATINRRVANANPRGSVSLYSHVAFIGRNPPVAPMCQAFTEIGEVPIPITLRFIFLGIDTSELTQMVIAMASGEDQPPPPPTTRSGM